MQGSRSVEASPHGTVTFLFSDIQDSTRLWERHPEAMRAALARHDAILWTAIEGRRGYVFSTAGDAFSAAFWTPAEGLAAALDVQLLLAAEPWPEAAVIRVRMGLHTGTADHRAGDYFGPAVNRTARIMASAHGGQVLVSLAMKELLRDQLADGVGLLDLGEHPLKGFARPERLFQVLLPGAPRDFPPLRTDRAKAGNLPVHLTRFVGRVGEMEVLRELVVAHRLVCVTGTGGMGKTRLALATGSALTGKFSDGVWFVELASVSQSDAVDAAAMAALGQMPIPGRTAREVIVTALASRRALVVADNCEHVNDAAADLVQAVLRSCPDVHVLATSRQPLGVSGERSFPLMPLAPEDQVELFCDRAYAVRPGAQIEQARVADLGSRLDGMPLAIELAAARLRSMSLAELTARLDERFRVLASDRGGEARHRTLEAVVDCSFTQLSTAEQRFFCRLSVFAGDFDIDAAVAVAGGQKELETLDSLDLLVQRSMLTASEQDDHTRYQLLETLRQYGYSHLESDDLAATVRRHAEHYMTVVAGYMRSLRTSDDEIALHGLARCWDNVRQAVHRALEAGDADLTIRLITPLASYAVLRPDPEVAHWASEALALPDASHHRLAFWTHLIVAQVAHTQLDLHRAEQHARLALEMLEAAGQPPFPRIYLLLGYILEFQGRFPEALSTLRSAVDLARAQGRTMDLIEALHNSVGFQVCAGNRWADEDLDELVELAARADNPRALATIRSAVGLAALVEGRVEAARLLDESADLAAGLPVEGPWRGWARIAEAGASPAGELAGLGEKLKAYDLSKVPFAFRVDLRSYMRALSKLDRHSAVALIDGAAPAGSIFPIDSRQAAERAQAVLGAAKYDGLVEQGRGMSTDDLAESLRAELEALGMRG